jgi:integrase
MLICGAARKNRWGHRDAAMILMAYRHGFRPAELVDLRWEQLEFASGALHVRRVKRGTPSTHPILGDELRALRRLQREQEPKSPFVLKEDRIQQTQEEWLHASILAGLSFSQLGIFEWHYTD